MKETTELQLNYPKGTDHRPSPCYFTYYSQVEQVQEPVPSDSPEVAQATISKMVEYTAERSSQGQVHLMVRRPETCLLLFGLHGAICLSLGVTDYTDFTRSHQDLGNLVSTYQVGNSHYVMIVYRCLVEYLKGIASQIHQTHTGHPPTQVWLRITSQPGSPSSLTNQSPPDDQLRIFVDLAKFHSNPEPSNVTDLSLSFPYHPRVTLEEISEDCDPALPSGTQTTESPEVPSQTDDTPVQDLDQDPRFTM